MFRTTLTQWFDRHRTLALLVVGAVVTALVAAAAVGFLLPGGGTPAPAAPPRFEVDHTLRPSVAQAEPIGGTSRAVGVLAGPDGRVEELVLDEVMLYVREAAELDAFLARWDGEVLDSFPPDDDGGQDHLVRVDVSHADPDRVVDDLRAAEAGWVGAHRVSDERVIRLLALAAAEWRAGTELMLDWLLQSHSIENGRMWDSPSVTANGEPENVFEWSYLRQGGALDIGVGRAWQLLRDEDRLRRQVRYLVVDGGFARNRDFPPSSKVRKGNWGKKNNLDCGGTSCPWHGTDVVLAGMATVGNRYGAAGPAGPVVSQLIAVAQSVEWWTTMRRTLNMTEAENPDVVNLSFTKTFVGDTRHAEKWVNRRMGQVRDHGALIVAAAGNDGWYIDTGINELTYPCQSVHVLCVGGMDGAGGIDPGSNWGGSQQPNSVQIYAPMCVLTLADPTRHETDDTTAAACGTSFASPFVGGVAALVMAADPSLGPDEVRKILIDTAHDDTDASGRWRMRRINAQEAVAYALAVPPTVTIDAPQAGKEYSVGHWLDLYGTATDALGREIPITWRSDVAGQLAEGSASTVPPPVAGTHVITATATDGYGRTGKASVTIEMVDTPPEVHIISPPAQAPPLLAGTTLDLVATSWDPDTYLALPDADTRWQVWRGGTVVHTATGHRSTLSAADLTPGSYQVRFTAGVSKAERTFTVNPLPPGEVPPTATITAPATGQNHGATAHAAPTVAFSGAGTDGHGAAVDGTRFRWVAHGTDESRVLCQGSAVPGSGSLGEIAEHRSCDGFEVELWPESGKALTTWTVWLEVYFDPASPTAVVTDSIDITIQYVVS